MDSTHEPFRLYLYDVSYYSGKIEIAPKESVRFFLSKLVEDYADEWLWRPAMYYRWKYDHKPLGLEIALGVRPTHLTKLGQSGIPGGLSNV